MCFLIKLVTNPGGGGGAGRLCYLPSADGSHPALSTWMLFQKHEWFLFKWSQTTMPPPLLPCSLCTSVGFIRIVCRGVHKVTDLEIFPVRISKDETLMPLSFHLSWALLGAWLFGLFRGVCRSFHIRLDLIWEPAFCWVFYFFLIFPCLFTICKAVFKLLFFCSF